MDNILGRFMSGLASNFFSTNKENILSRKPMSDLEFSLKLGLQDTQILEIVSKFRNKIASIFHLPKNIVYPNDTYKLLSSFSPLYPPHDWDEIDIVVYLEDFLEIDDDSLLQVSMSKTVGEWIKFFILHSKPLKCHHNFED